jgi:hypothetical protein
MELFTGRGAGRASRGPRQGRGPETSALAVPRPWGSREGGSPRDFSCSKEIGSVWKAIGRRPIPRTCGAQASADSAGLSCVEAASATPLATPAGLSISCIDLGRRELKKSMGGAAAVLTRLGRDCLAEPASNYAWSTRRGEPGDGGANLRTAGFTGALGFSFSRIRSEERCL